MTCQDATGVRMGQVSGCDRSQDVTSLRMLQVCTYCTTDPIHPTPEGNDIHYTVYIQTDHHYTYCIYTSIHPPHNLVYIDRPIYHPMGKTVTCVLCS